MDADLELVAMQKAAAALAPLEDDARRRAIGWLSSRFGIAEIPRPIPPSDSRVAANEAGDEELFPDFYHRVLPSTDKERAVVGAYWLRRAGTAQFQSQELNSMLKQLGHGVSNITDALSSAIAEKPALVIQVRKSGTSRQARKSYKITDAGVRWVDAKLNAGGDI